MADVIERKGYERFEDLHIDVVDPLNRAPDTWLRAAADCLAVAAATRDQERWPFQVALGMSLHSAPERLGLNFHGFHAAEKELDWSPPSLYLFPEGDDSWLGGAESQQLPAQFLPPGPANVKAYLREWYDEGDGEYRRTLWLVA